MRDAQDNSSVARIFAATAVISWFIAMFLQQEHLAGVRDMFIYISWGTAVYFLTMLFLSTQEKIKSLVRIAAILLFSPLIRVLYVAMGKAMIDYFGMNVANKMAEMVQMSYRSIVGLWNGISRFWNTENPNQFNDNIDWSYSVIAILLLYALIGLGRSIYTERKARGAQS